MNEPAPAPAPSTPTPDNMPPTPSSPAPAPATPAPTTPPPSPQVEPRKRRTIVWSILGIIALLLLAAAGIASAIVLGGVGVKPPPSVEAPATAPTALKARVIYLTGEAWKIVSSRKTEIREGDELEQGDELITYPNTRLVLSLDDGSVIRINENAKVALSELLPASIILGNEKGTMFARVTKDVEHTFAVKAKTYTVTSMGTAFSVENEDEVKVKVYESAVTITESSSFEATGSAETEVKQNEQWEETTKETEVLADSDIAQNEFLAWSVKEDNIALSTPTPSATPKSTAKPTEKKTEANPGTGSITLTASATGEGVALSWQVSGDLNVSSGFKIVKKTSENPSFPGDPYQYLSNSDARSYTWSLKDGQTWHFRVCQYIGGTCGVYSNDVSVQAPSGGESTTTQVKSITLTGQKGEGNKVNLSWNIDGNSPLGFKVVWSRNSGPTYPNRDGDHYHYYSESGKRDDEVGSLDGGATYYFRVCEYLGGKCGVYSNEVSIGM
jgi:hypothetical protein